VRGPFSRQLLADVARYQVQQKLQTIGVGQIDQRLRRSEHSHLVDVQAVERGDVSDISGALAPARRGPRGRLQTPGRDDRASAR
jgi:hypothetical protein